MWAPKQVQIKNHRLGKFTMCLGALNHRQCVKTAEVRKTNPKMRFSMFIE